MLQLQKIRENKEAYIEALAKRNIEGGKLLDDALQLDEKRRATQTELDATLAKSNTLSKEIGMLFKSGKTAEANAVKATTAELKETSKNLGEQLNLVSNELQELLYQIPNIPHDSVPKGNTDEDNEEIFREGEIPELQQGALPHWELAKK